MGRTANRANNETHSHALAKAATFGIWQPKFWEHTIEEEDDFESHFDYIHFNPVKHGYVRCPVDWEWSSFHRWVRAGVYPKNWACGDRADVPTFDHIEKTVGE